MAEKIAIRDAYGKALLELGKKNEKIVALDADVGVSTKSALFGKPINNNISTLISKMLRLTLSNILYFDNAFIFLFTNHFII